MIEKNIERIWVSYSEIHNLVRIGCEIVVKNYNYVPDFLVGISGGGLMPVRLAKTFLKEYSGMEIPIYVIGISNYDSNNNQLPEPRITQGLDEKIREEVKGKKVLLVDEVDDTRKTLEKASNYLLDLKVDKLKILVIHSKEKEKQGKLPEGVDLYFVKKIPDVWVNYQWDFKELFDYEKQKENLKVK
ncbi:MAG: phosphoribosyltransferase family protein [Candidatus Woesearchaeota archaeon]